MGDSHLEWLSQFAKGLKLLDDYDHEKLDAKGLSKQQAMYPDIQEYQEVVKAMKKDFESGVFGKEKDGSFHSAVQGRSANLFTLLSFKFEKNAFGSVVGIRGVFAAVGE